MHVEDLTTIIRTDTNSLIIDESDDSDDSDANMGGRANKEDVRVDGNDGASSTSSKEEVIHPLIVPSLASLSSPTTNLISDKSEPEFENIKPQPITPEQLNVLVEHIQSLIDDLPEDSNDMDIEDHDIADYVESSNVENVGDKDSSIEDKKTFCERIYYGVR
jgi:hypothetical protein